MFKLFRKKKVTIDSIKIPKFGLKEVENTKEEQAFVNQEQTLVLLKNFFDLEPDLPTIKDIDFLRKFYRELIAPNGGALIEVDLLQLKGFATVKTIFKFPMDPKGMAYVGSITIPFENYSYVVKVQAAEVGMTGMRDAVILDKLMGTKEVFIGDDDEIKNWFSDPYDSEITNPGLRNKSDARQYDAEFPEHPLSLVRKMLDNIEQEIVFDTKLTEIAKFDK
ncbi:hypothetical protein H2O64_14670 [Kordia sp. YSTF-M3]|uniref:Uncharacterized protein n=1 Tax=Kordia aestuariivivens TaxID=2759037 RepID=A0ABR7QBJ3_9FLAO|nr:hypothetical protein [Kordia aestuariivivens]MBC8755919.1 hypothetical protein [Kordia aestuariivivens]